MANHMPAPTPFLYRLLGLLLLAALVMIVLTAAGRLTISWWVATSPIWAPWAIAIAACALYMAIRLLILTVRR